MLQRNSIAFDARCCHDFICNKNGEILHMVVSSLNEAEINYVGKHQSLFCFSTYLVLILFIYIYTDNFKNIFK